MSWNITGISKNVSTHVLSGGMLCEICTLLVLFLVIRLVYILYQIHFRGSLPTSTSSKVQYSRLLSVAGSGGHTAELLQLLTAATITPSSKTLSNVTFSPRHYIVAATDTMSQSKIELFERSMSDRTLFHNARARDAVGSHTPRSHSAVITHIPRAREVGQSYLSSILSTFYSQLYCVPYVILARPDVLLVNGPGTCIPVCCMVFLLRLLGVCQGRIVYVESICRVNSLSLSAKILLFFADHILVQWPKLADRHRRCKYIGRLVS